MWWFWTLSNLENYTEFEYSELFDKKYYQSTKRLKEDVKKEAPKPLEVALPSDVNSSRQIELKEVASTSNEQHNSDKKIQTNFKLHENPEIKGIQRRCSQRKKKQTTFYTADTGQKIGLHQARKRKAGGRPDRRIRTREKRRKIDKAICWENRVDTTSTHEEDESLVATVNTLLQKFFTENQSNNYDSEFVWEDWEELVNQQLEVETGKREEF